MREHRHDAAVVELAFAAFNTHAGATYESGAFLLQQIESMIGDADSVEAMALRERMRAICEELKQVNGCLLKMFELSR